ncbi:MAG: DUF2279 domain-containing protein [Sphingobacteriaceae bacterium]|nr:DUF2279 domain-containing protein [Sphingobacteriaceae bacterium]
MRIKCITGFILIGLLPILMHSQKDSLPNYEHRKMALGISTSAISAGSLLYLNYAWYANYSSDDFHFFNDNTEWLQMDKAGHAFTTYQLGRLMMNAFDWAGVNKKKKLFIGGTMGLMYMTAIECLDGKSKGWGFSWGDMGANVAGTGMAIGQEALWNEQRLMIKFSFAQSQLAEYNPSLLGENIYTQVLKDYNGQTYWLSVSPFSFIPSQKKLPKWLCLSFGYSAYGMLSGHENGFTVRDANGVYYQFNRERRFYLSFDIDFTKIKTKSKFLKGVFSAINILKIPAPALEFTKRGAKGYGLYL